MVELEIDGVTVSVREEDAGRLLRFVADAGAALRDQPEILGKLDSVERHAASVRRMTDSVVRAAGTLLDAVDGDGAFAALLERLQQPKRSPSLVLVKRVPVRAARSRPARTMRIEGGGG